VTDATIAARRLSAIIPLYVPPVPTPVNRTLLVASLGCLLLLSAAPVSGVSSGSALAQQGIDTDDVLMSIAVEEDGDAVWEIEYRTRLETDDDERAFAELQSGVESDPDAYAGRFRDRMNGTAGAAENATGREMAITEITVSAENRTLPQEYGVLTYRFRWSNFAAVDGDRLIVGDAIDGLFLDDETSLLLSWPEEYDLLGASPEPTETRESAVAYNGPLDFAGGEPRIELGVGAASGAGTDGGDVSGDDGDTEGDAEGGRSLPGWASIAVLALALLAGIVTFLAYWRREGRPDAGAGGGPEPGGDPGGDEPGGDDASAPPDGELLSNEEQVLRLIESEGGRMKQQAVAEKLDWTDAKTSQVTKTLRENGDLEGFRLGRENVLTLPEEGSNSELG
jgi:hypothetical protein